MAQSCRPQSVAARRVRSTKGEHRCHRHILRRNLPAPYGPIGSVWRASLPSGVSPDGRRRELRPRSVCPAERGPGEVALRVLISEPEFHAGILAGLAGLVIAVGILGARRAFASDAPSRPGSVPGVIGPVLVLVAVSVISGLGPFTEVESVPARTATGLVILWVAGQVDRPGSYRRAIAIGVAIVGGVLLVDPSADFAAWVVVLLVVGPALGGAAAADLDRSGGRSGTGPLLFGIAVVALYLTVPDTELALVLLGVTAPLMLLAFPWPIARLGDGGAYAAVGLFLWVATLGGVGRPAATVGGAVALGVLVLDRVGRALSRRFPIGGRSGGADGLRPRIPCTGALVIAQAVAAVWASRVAGGAAVPKDALLLAIPSVVVALAATTLFRPSDPATVRPGHGRYRRSPRKS